MASKTITIPVAFEVEYETHPLKKFQSEGHFVPAVRQRGADGRLTLHERKWKGSTVHAMNLFRYETEGEGIGAGTGKRVQCEQLARSIADSKEEAELLMAEQIASSFWGMLNRAAIQRVNQDMLRKVMWERDTLLNREENTRLRQVMMERDVLLNAAKQAGVNTDAVLLEAEAILGGKVPMP